MANTNKRSADLKIHAVIGTGDSAEFVFLGTGYKNRSGSFSLLLSREWQLVHKDDGRVLEAAPVAKDDGTEFVARVKMLVRPTKGKAESAA